MVVVVTALGVVVLLLGVLVAGLLRSHAEILRALHDLNTGQAVPPQPQSAAPGNAAADITGETPDGEVVRLAVGGGRPTLVAFLSSGCASCVGLWQSFVPEAAADLVGDGRVVLVAKGPEAESPAEIARLAPLGVTTVMSSRAWTDYAPPAVPYFVYVDGDGTVGGEGSAASWDRVADLLRRARNDTRLYSRRDLVTVTRPRADRA